MRHLFGVQRSAQVSEFADHHLVEKAKSGRARGKWLEQLRRQLKAAVEFFGADRDLATIRVSDVQAYASWLAERTNGRSAKLTGASRRQYLTGLSGLYRRAISEGCVPPGYDPVAALVDKPTRRRYEARWLEPHDAALLLEAARLYRLPHDRPAISFMHALLATFMLTGGRASEIFGLEVEDVSFDRKTVTFRPNQWRDLKTHTSRRTIPLWPQLEEILREHVFGSGMALGRLVFPSPHPRGRKAYGESPLTDIRRPLDLIATGAGWKPGAVRTKMFRHGYAAARLQTLDRGEPVSVWTVSRELGHGSTALVEQVYGHLGTVRHRASVVEFRADAFAQVLGDRLKAVRAVTS
jgi:integrase